MDELDLQFDESFKTLHKLCMAVEVDVDVSGENSDSEILIQDSYEDLINDYFPAA